MEKEGNSSMIMCSIHYIQEGYEAGLGGGIVLEASVEGLVLEGGREELLERLPCAGIVAEPQVAAHNMLEEPELVQRLVLVLDGADHVVQDRGDGVEALRGGANVREASVVEEDLLHDEGRNGLAQLLAGLHDAQAERDDLRVEKEGNHVGVVKLHERAHDAQRREPQVLKGTRLGRRVQEGVKVHGNVHLEEERLGLSMGGNTLQQRQRVAHPTARSKEGVRGRREVRRG